MREVARRATQEGLHHLAADIFMVAALHAASSAEAMEILREANEARARALGLTS